MQTTVTQSRPDVGVSAAQEIIKTCINCGCCNAICPTFDILADERDSPRGRINLIKDMLENDQRPNAEVVSHLDRCLSCNACLTACPSDVDYMHLIDIGRSQIEKKVSRPVLDRLIRTILAEILPNPDKFRLALAMARPLRGLAPLLRAAPGLRAYASLLDAIPKGATRRTDELLGGEFSAKGERQKRVLIPSGCVQKVLAPDINRSAVRLLTEIGVDVVLPVDDGCCGALVLHLGKDEEAREQAKRNVDNWYPQVEEGLDAIVMTTSGCGTTIKDYGHLLAHEPHYAEKAAKIASIARDISEFLTEVTLPKPIVKPGLKVAYHSACSLQHAQQVMNPPRKLLLKAGFKLARPKDEQLCCGSAGTYSILQPEISRRLRDRKVESLEEIGADVIAAGNIGCIEHIGGAASLPVLHTVQLLDWAYTGKPPSGLAEASESSS